MKAVAVTPQGQLCTKITGPVASDQPKAWARQVRELLAQWESEQRGPALAVGLCAPGLAAPDGRSIACLPERLEGLEGFDWAQWLGSGQPVPVLNDAHAALLGEAWLGAARGYRNVLLLTLGTGVGGAAIVDGRLLRGQIGRAGHFGHVCLDPDGPPDICGMPGSLELAVGNCSLRQRSGGRFDSTEGLVAAHLAGDAEATRLWLKAVQALACAIASLINALDPAAVILGGGIAQAGPALFEPLQQWLDKVEWRPLGHRVPVLPAALGEWAGAFGAAWHALQAQNG
jgi:glucokinase